LIVAAKEKRVEDLTLGISCPDQEVTKLSLLQAHWVELVMWFFPTAEE
jgi:hypothetical protein